MQVFHALHASDLSCLRPNERKPARFEADRAKKTASFREILDAMWLFNKKFERALAEFNDIKSAKKAKN